MHRFFRTQIRFFLFAVTVLLTAFLAPEKVHGAPRLQNTADKEKTVIVIDPGHGGENRGTIEGWEDEKLMTMTTAMAMYEELSLYEDAEVYLTHTEDVDMSLKERAKFAQSVGADFLFSVHYNASKSHELFGSEVWVSAFAPYNGYGYQFGYELLSDIREMGLLVRGVKTRLGDDGDDYYGIIRESVALGIPALIIEHCHVDEARDAVYCENEEQMRNFGKMDATAVARYFGLKSSALNVDYSDYPLAESDAAAPVVYTLSDSTEPDACELTLEEADYEGYTLTLTVSARDQDSPLLYYSYSTDRGLSFTPKEPWPESDTLTGSSKESFSLTIPVTPDTWPRVILRAYNMYDLYTESACFVSEKPFALPEEEETDPVAELEILPVSDSLAQSSPDEGDGQPGPDFSTLFRFCLLAALFLLVLLIGAQAVAFRIRGKRRRQYKNKPGRHSRQPR